VGKGRRLTGIARVARHEAGHAVASLACGVIVSCVVVTSEAGASVTAHKPGKRDPMVDGIIAWSGSVAEGVDWINEDDARPFTRYGFTNRSIVTMRQMAAALLSENALAVDVLAAELVERGALFGPDVKRVAVRACPWLRRDAPRYPKEHLPVFRAEYERMCRRYKVTPKGKPR
jgi:hypothetical protein